MRFKQSPYYLILCSYLALNIFFSLLVFDNQNLYGEVNQIQFDSGILSSTILIISAYFFFNYFLFNKFFQPLVDGFKDGPIYSYWVDAIVFFLQLLFFVYFYSNGLYVANSTVRDSSILSYLWVLIPVDLIFLVYYGYQRDSKFFKFNLFFALFSTMLRGWTGLLLTFFYMEFARFYVRKRISPVVILSTVFLCILAYPFLLNVKLALRFSSDLSLGSIFEAFTATANVGDSYFDALVNSTTQIFARLQIVSHAIAFINNIDLFSSQLDSGVIYPAWLEGIHGLALDIVSGTSKKLSLSNSFANFIDPLSVDVNWNANPTIVGWLAIDPSFGIITMLYLVLLCSMSVYIYKKMPRTFDAQSIIWYAWLVYIMPGWFATLFLFIYSQFLFFVLSKPFRVANKFE